MIVFEPFDERTGYIPEFFDENDPRSAREQINQNYKHGGGWFPLKGWKLFEDNSIRYPGDRTLMPVSTAKLRNETIVVYPGAWVAIIQPDRSYEIARID